MYFWLIGWVKRDHIAKVLNGAGFCKWSPFMNAPALVQCQIEKLQDVPIPDTKEDCLPPNTTDYSSCKILSVMDFLEFCHHLQVQIDVQNWPDRCQFTIFLLTVFSRNFDHSKWTIGFSKSNFQQRMVKVTRNSTHGLESLSEQVQTEMLRLAVLTCNAIPELRQHPAAFHWWRNTGSKINMPHTLQTTCANTNPALYKQKALYWPTESTRFSRWTQQNQFPNFTIEWKLGILSC